MMNRDVESVALTLVGKGKGILAADETVPTLTKRFDTLGIQSSEQSRRTYREILFTSPGAAEFLSGVIMYDETIRALQDPALEAWRGRDKNLPAGQRALYRRAKFNAAASVGEYSDEMEAASESFDDPPHRRNWSDD